MKSKFEVEKTLLNNPVTLGGGKNELLKRNSVQTVQFQSSISVVRYFKGFHSTIRVDVFLKEK